MGDLATGMVAIQSAHQYVASLPGPARGAGTLRQRRRARGPWHSTFDHVPMKMPLCGGTIGWGLRVVLRVHDERAVGSPRGQPCDERRVRSSCIQHPRYKRVIEPPRADPGREPASPQLGREGSSSRHGHLRSAFPGAILKQQRSLRHQLGRPGRWATRILRRGVGSRHRALF